MIRTSRLVVAGLLVVLTSGLVSYAVSAAVPGALLTAGTTRYAVSQGLNHVTTFETVFKNLPGLSTTITIPGGKKGDVMIVFCGQATTTAIMHVRALVGGAVASPGQVLLHENSPQAGNCAIFSKLGVSAGTKTVTMQWQTYSGSVSDMYARSMIVIVNLH
jgi:hypothetical protein